MDTDTLRRAARRWLDEDPDPETRAELSALLDAADDAGLAERFGASLGFGTAGIRGPLGAGPARMNRAVVRRVTAGLANRLRREHPDGAPLVVVGRDARRKSDDFAAETVGVLAAAGFAVRPFHKPVPTPLLAFAVRHLGAVAGVQITASHNPPTDNGYKVYWSDGAQILPDLAADISAAIEAVGSLADLGLEGGEMYRSPYGEIVHAYLEAALSLSRRPDARELTIVYTPLHGVAGELLAELFTAAGFRDLHVVTEQARPDPDFPTVSFPNPEVPGAMDLALALAGERGADLVLANDPDGDRVAAAIPEGVQGAGRWRVLTGDEIGCLLADYLLAGGRHQHPLVATTVVSSQLLRRIAEHHAAAYVETLTGFKWLARAARDGESQGLRMVLAYEQALGVMIGTEVLDKDGLSAALVLAELAAALRAEGRTVADALDDLARRFGVHATDALSVPLDPEHGTELVVAALERLRRSPPRRLAGIEVTALADHAAGTRTRADGSVEALTTPPTDLIGLTLADGARVQVRPSGTEPLLKFYLEVVEPVDAGESVVGARERARARLSELGGAFLTAAGFAPPAGARASP
jgi:phosphomannomutase